VILSRHGFAEVRRRGSHIVMQKKLPQGTTTVPVPDHKEIRIATLQTAGILSKRNIDPIKWQKKIRSEWDNRSEKPKTKR
jgi:predicted RNA binding protein YcfA (HicA-like mRNA interferase family)